MVSDSGDVVQGDAVRNSVSAKREAELWFWARDSALRHDVRNELPSSGTPVGLDQLNQVLFNWQQASSLAVVPEPATLNVVLLAALALLAGRRFVGSRYSTA